MSRICENVCSALVFHFGSRRKTFWSVLSGSAALCNVEIMLDGYLSNDTLRSAPAAERNKAPILEVIRAKGERSCAVAKASVRVDSLLSSLRLGTAKSINS